MNRISAGLIILLGLASPALAQRVQAPGTVAIACAYNTSPPTLTSGWFGYAQCDSSGKLIVISSGGGGGGAVTIADGADVTQGAIADAAATSGSTGTVSAKLRLMTTQLTTLNTTLGSPFQAGGSIGNTSFGATQATAANLNATVVGAGSAGTANAGVMTVQGIASMTKLLVTPDSVALPANQSVNISQVNGVTTLTGAGATGTGAQRVTAAQDTTTIAGSAPGTAGSASTNVLTVQGIASMTKLLVTPDANSAVNVAQINGVTPLMGNGVTGTGSQRVTIASDNTAFSVNSQPTPVTSGGLTVYNVQPAASDNHVVIKAGAGQVYKIEAFNNSATINYVRLYNATTGFNGCNSATNLVWQGIIPASTSGAGLASSWELGMPFATGISICVTSGYAQTDTTNATASALIVNIGYK